MAATDEITGTKSSPDVQKIQAMGGRLLSVTKLLNGKHGVPIRIASQVSSLDEIWDLPKKLVTMAGAGPGTYKFEVFEQGGPGVDKWVNKIGNEFPEESMSSSNQNAPVVVDANGVVKQLGYGFSYDEKLGLLITGRGLFPWRPGEPLPEQLDGYHSKGTVPTPTPAAATPIPSLATLLGGADSKTDDRLRAAEERAKAAEERIKDAEARAERERTEAARREEIRELREAMRAQADDSNKRFEALLAKISEKPSGPSMAEQELLRRAEAAERAAADERREAERRREMAEMAARQEAALREVTANKQDPMFPALIQMMQGQQQSNQAMFAAMQNIAAQQVQSSEKHLQVISERLGGSALTPERTVELIRLAKDRGPEAAATQGMIDMFKSTFQMAQDVVRMQGELYSASQGPAWVGMAEAAAGKLGQIAQGYFQTKAAGEAREADAKAQAVKMQAEAMRLREARMLEQQRLAIAGAQPAPTPAPAPAPMTPPPHQQARPAAAMNGFPQQADFPTAPPVAPAPAATTAAEPDGDDDDNELIDLSTLPADQVRSIIGQSIENPPTGEPPETWFFGAAGPHVNDLRQAILQGTMPPDAVADALMQARTKLRSFGMRPPAMELIEAGHALVTMEYIIPSDDPQVAVYRRAVADAVQTRISQEMGGAPGN